MKHAFSWVSRGTISALIVVGLSACGNNGSSDPTVEPGSPDPERVVYQGRVIDGYLRNALVWLDLNHNYLPDTDEPATLTGKDGVFRFSAQELEGIEAPHQYSLMVHARAACTPDEDLATAPKSCITQDEDLMLKGDDESGTIPLSYVLAAPPGVSTITPLSTLVKLEFDRLLADPTQNPAALSIATAHASVRTTLNITDNLLQDYLVSNNAKLTAYAKALVTTLQVNLAQLSGSPETALSNLNSVAAFELGQQLLANAKAITNLVDRIFPAGPTAESVAAFNYLRDFPVLGLSTELPNKIVLSRIKWSVAASTEDTGTELAAIVWPEDAEPETPLKQIAAIEYDWRPNSRIAGAIVDGWLNPGFFQEQTQGVIPRFGFDPKLPRTAVDGKPDLAVTSTATDGRTTAIDMKLLGSPVPADYSTPSFAFSYSEDGVLEKVTETLKEGEDTITRTLTLTYEGAHLTRQLQVPSSTDPERAEEVLFTYAGGLPDIATRQLRVIVSAAEPAEIELGAAEVLSHTKYRYQDGRTSSICERTISTDDVDTCTHFRYTAGARKYEYLTEHAALNETFADPTGNGHIVAIAEYIYAALLDTAK